MLKKKIVFILLTVLLAFFFVNRILFFKPTIFEKAASCFAYPAIKLSSIVSRPIKKIFEKKLSYKELEEKYIKLKEENSKFCQELIQLKATLNYQNKSTELIDFKKRFELKNSILSKVLLKTLTQEEHSIIVNRGSRDGIEKDMIAIYKLQLVGRVQQVTPFYSKIRLITDSQSKVSAYTNSNSDSTRGIVEGSSVINRCHLRYISHLKKIHNGDFVLSSGQGLIFPEGFCLGKIIDIKSEDICYHVEIEPLVDFKKIEMCLLTSKSKINIL